MKGDRHQFDSEPMNESDMDTNPWDQFEAWFEQVLNAKIADPYAMTLCTADKSGMPTARVVYMRDVSDAGIVFYTNYQSEKGRQLTENPQACINFFWQELTRQVRMVGDVDKVGADVSDAYFAQRPRASQLGAWASDQSSAIHSRDTLQNRVEAYTEKFKNSEVPRPPHWGGYILKPSRMEFWQGQDSRLHDRLSYRKADDGRWTLNRLAP